MGRGRQGAFALAAAIGFVLMALAFVERPTTAAAAPEPQRRARAKPRAKRVPPKPAEMKFSHQATAHHLACAFCHTFPSANWNVVRTGDAAIPDVTEFPQHSSCLKCHRTEFFARERPAPRICAVCHVGVTPKFTERHPFPNPVESFHRSPRSREFVSAFAVWFPHDRHLELFGEGDTCLNCHVTKDPQSDGGEEYALKPPAELGDGFWLKKGTFKTSPNGHTTCFTCHAIDSGMKPEPADCAVCHRLQTRQAGQTDFDTTAAATTAVLDPASRGVWRERNASATFRHEGGLHADVACVKCHNVASLDTTDPMSARVGIVSCGGDSGCHITGSVDEGGALNFEILQRASDAAFRCTKCHIAYAGAPVPASHPAALPGAKTGTSQ
jgi:hypothetical protein